MKKIRYIPYGYTMRNGRTVIAQDEATVIREIFSAYINGASLQSIAELLTESRELGTAARHSRGYRGRDSPCFAFLLQAFSFSNKKKMPKRGKCEKFDYSGTRR